MAHTTEQIVAVRQWTPSLISFRTTRSPSFRFTPGHYARLGLLDSNAEVIWRPFSMVSSPHHAHLEFFATLVPSGKFSAALSLKQVGDTLYIERSSYGFMTLDSLASGSELWLLASGTGLGPFLSILGDPIAWRNFETIVLVHSVRYSNELAYADEIAAFPKEPWLQAKSGQLRYLPVVTREPCLGALSARIPQLIKDGRLERAAGIVLEVKRSRIMVCGNPKLGSELRSYFTARDFKTSRQSALGELAFEAYWQ